MVRDSDACADADSLDAAPTRALSDARETGADRDSAFSSAFCAVSFAASIPVGVATSAAKNKRSETLVDYADNPVPSGANTSAGRGGNGLPIPRASTFPRSRYEWVMAKVV